MKKILFVLSVLTSLAAISCSNPSSGNVPVIIPPVVTTPTEPETPTTPAQPETPTEPETPAQPQTPETPSEPETPAEPETPVQVSPWILAIKNTSAGINGNAGTDFVYIDETIANPFAALVDAGTIQLELVGKRELKTSSSIIRWFGTSATDKINVINQYKIYVHKDAANTEYFLEDSSLKYYLAGRVNNTHAFRYRLIKENNEWKMSAVNHNSITGNNQSLTIAKNSYAVKNN